MENIEWNVAIEQVRENTGVLVLPDDQGNLSVPLRGYVVRWPVNPHFTGRNMIAKMLTEISNSPVFGWNILSN